MNDHDDPPDLPDDPPVADQLSAHLRDLLGDDRDLGPRTAAQVDRRLRAGSVGSLCVELLGVGWWTVTEMLTGTSTVADGGPRGDDDG